MAAGSDVSNSSLFAKDLGICNSIRQIDTKNASASTNDTVTCFFGRPLLGNADDPVRNFKKFLSSEKSHEMVTLYH